MIHNVKGLYWCSNVAMKERAITRPYDLYLKQKIETAEVKLLFL